MKYLGEDIKLNTNGDLELNISSGDFAIVSGVDCLLQDLEQLFKLAPLDDIDNPALGTRIYDIVNCERTNVTVLEARKEIKRVLKSDFRIDKNSIKITTQESENTLTFFASFTTLDGKTISEWQVPLEDV